MKKHTLPRLAAFMLFLCTAMLLFSSCGDTPGIGSETTDRSETTVGMYDEYILTEEDLAELNEAYAYESIIRDPGYKDKSEAEIIERLEKIKNNKYHKFAPDIDGAMGRSADPDQNFYFGKYGDCIVVAINAGAQTGWNPYYSHTYTLGEYIFDYHQSFMFVCYESRFYNPEDAYEMGLITDSDVENMYELYSEYY